MPIIAYTENLCNVYNKERELSCKYDDLELLEDLSAITNPKAGGKENIRLLACRVCGQVYRESVVVYNNTPYPSYDKIKGQRIDQCHCIGYLAEMKVLFEEKLFEGDPQWFCWDKQTLMKCKKCGKTYKELIKQNNYDAFYSREYIEESQGG